MKPSPYLFNLMHIVKHICDKNVFPLFHFIEKNNKSFHILP